MMSKRFNYDQGNTKRPVFFMIAKFLFNYDPKVVDNNVKMLYAILRDYLELSFVNQLKDDNGDVYVLFSREKMCELLGLSENTIRKCLNVLKDLGLIEEDPMGLGKPNRIYVLDVDGPENSLHYNSLSETASQTDAEITSNIVSGTLSRIEADITSRIDADITSRIEADIASRIEAGITSRIDAMIASRIDAVFASQIEVETASRSQNDGATTSYIEVETVARSQNDGATTSYIEDETVSRSYIKPETSLHIEVDTTPRSQIDAETTSCIEVETASRSHIEPETASCIEAKTASYSLNVTGTTSNIDAVRPHEMSTNNTINNTYLSQSQGQSQTDMTLTPNARPATVDKSQMAQPPVPQIMPAPPSLSTPASASPSVQPKAFGPQAFPKHPVNANKPSIVPPSASASPSVQPKAFGPQAFPKQPVNANKPSIAAPFYLYKSGKISCFLQTLSLCIP